MRGLLMAFLAMDISGPLARGDRARMRSTKTSAKKTTATTV